MTSYVKQVEQPKSCCALNTMKKKPHQKGKDVADDFIKDIFSASANVESYY